MERIERPFPLPTIAHTLGCLLVATTLLSGCSDEAAPDNGGNQKGYSHVQLTLGTSSLNVGTRSTWNDPNATDSEMMKQAYVVMTKDGKVESIYKVTPSASTESEREMVDYITTQNGTYTFYNIANLDPEASTTDTEGKVTSVTLNGLTFTVGNDVPSGVESSTSTTIFNNYVIPTTGIPMTNFETHEVSNDVTLELQLYRQLSKMRFQFTNNTTSTVKINKVTIGSITKDDTPIYFFPQKDANENLLVEWPDADAHKTINNFTYYDGGDTPTEIGTDDDTKTATLPDVYFNESQSSHATGRYPLTIEMKRLSSDGTTWTDDERHALINRTASSNNDIARNSYVIVPIALTDYVFDLEAFFYPPIGGYPPFSMTKYNDDYYATFIGSGDFQLIPHIYKYADRDDPTQWFMLNDQTKIESYSDPDVSDPNGIFSEAPHVDSTTGEILGTLSGNTGRASMKITIYIKVNDTQTQVYNRTVYFIAQSE